MTKIQKIWMWVFLGMFVIPEILWSPILNILYELGQSGNVTPLRDNFLVSPENFRYFQLINFLQLIGIILLFVMKYHVREKKLADKFLLFIFFMVALLNLIVLYLSFAMGNISF